MNLHQMASGAIGRVNPFVTASIEVSIPSVSTLDDGTRVPAYAAPVSVSCQRQSLQYSDIAQLDGLNIQGIRDKIYLNGDWNAIVRPDRKGGDLITMPDNTKWLVAVVLENWPDWTCVAVSRQLP